MKYTQLVFRISEGDFEFLEFSSELDYKRTKPVIHCFPGSAFVWCPVSTERLWKKRLLKKVISGLKDEIKRLSYLKMKLEDYRENGLI